MLLVKSCCIFTHRISIIFKWTHLFTVRLVCSMLYNSIIGMLIFLFFMFLVAFNRHVMCVCGLIVSPLIPFVQLRSRAPFMQLSLFYRGAFMNLDSIHRIFRSLISINAVLLHLHILFA